MKQDEIILLLNHVTIPIYKIERDLGMPKTTLQKAIKGERELPKKWAIKLQETYGTREVKNDVTEPIKEESATEQTNLDWKQQLLQLRQNKKQ